MEAIGIPRLVLSCWLLTAVVGVSSEGTLGITEFSRAEESGLTWQIVDDRVMGGRSQGQVALTDHDSMVFRGQLSLENNGGFSSVRADLGKVDWSPYEGVALKVKGDGRRYQLRLTTDAKYRYWDVSFRAGFPTEKGKWSTVFIPFDAFEAGFRGRSLPTVKFDPKTVRRIGILLGDKNPGSFQLEIDSLWAYSKS